MNQAKAFVLASALYKRDTTLCLEDMAEELYHTVEVLGYNDSDERKADLYSQLAEKLQEEMPFHLAVSVIDAAMDETDRRFPRG